MSIIGSATDVEIRADGKRFTLKHTDLNPSGRTDRQMETTGHSLVRPEFPNRQISIRVVSKSPLRFITNVSPLGVTVSPTWWED